jgi:hypothetical protein
MLMLRRLVAPNSSSLILSIRAKKQAKKEVFTQKARNSKEYIESLKTEVSKKRV